MLGRNKIGDNMRKSKFRQSCVVIFVKGQLAGPRDVCSCATEHAAILEVRAIPCLQTARASRVNDSMTDELRRKQVELAGQFEGVPPQV
jgi:hypothetical protein